MPSKGQRAASRQAKLRQKRRRSKGGAQLFDPGPTESKRVAEEGVEPEPQRAPRPVSVAPSTTQTPRRPRQRSPAELAPRYEYLGAELRHIGILTIVMLAILAALSFFLGR